MLNMVFKYKKIILILVVGMAVSQAFAQYEMRKYSINSGGSKMTEGSYEMNASIGQTDASGKLSAGNYSLDGGFWHENNDLIFKNGFE